jgi:class 3 adenylate cyclase
VEFSSSFRLTGVTAIFQRWLAIFFGVIALILAGWWLAGPIVLSFPPAYLAMGARMWEPFNEHGFFINIGLPFFIQTLFADVNSPFKANNGSWPELVFLLLIGANAILGAAIGVILAIWRNDQVAIRSLALAVSALSIYLVGFLLLAQDGLRGHYFEWPLLPRFIVETVMTAILGAALLWFEQFTRSFPRKVEDWEIAAAALQWKTTVEGPVYADQPHGIIPRAARFMISIRALPAWLVILHTLANLLYFAFSRTATTDFDPHAHFSEKVILFSMVISWAVFGAVLVGFTWLFGLSLAVKLRAVRRNCTAEERRQTDWLYAGGLGVALLLLVFNAGLFYQFANVTFFGTGRKLSDVGYQVFLLLFPAGGLVLLLALTMAVLFGRTFGPKPLLKRTLLITGVGVVMSLLLAVIERWVATTILSHSSVAMQRGFSTAVAGGIVAVTLGLFRRRIESWLDRLLNRFMPASVIADGKRRDLVVAFSDLGGYTALSATDEAQALHVAGHFQKVAVAVARQNSGRIVKTIGDAVMWVFATPAAAFTATLALSVEFKRAVQADQLPQLPVNSGVHFGSVVEAPGGDVYGAAVNLAARLQGAAKDGTVVASSEAVLEATGGFRFESLGKLELKNVPTPIACFRVFAAA